MLASRRLFLDHVDVDVSGRHADPGELRPDVFFRRVDGAAPGVESPGYRSG